MTAHAAGLSTPISRRDDLFFGAMGMLIAVARMSRMVPIPPAVVATGPLFYFGVGDVLLIALVAYDLITRGRVHPVTLWGGAFIIASQVIRLAVSGTHGWLAFAALITGG